MAIEVFDTRYGDYKKQIPDLILVILAKEYPLKIGEICYRFSGSAQKSEYHGRKKNPDTKRQGIQNR